MQDKNGIWTSMSIKKVDRDRLNQLVERFSERSMTEIVRKMVGILEGWDERTWRISVVNSMIGRIPLVASEAKDDSTMYSNLGLLKSMNERWKKVSEGEI